VLTVVGLALLIAAIATVVDRVFYGTAAHRAMSATKKTERDHRIEVLKVMGDNRLPRRLDLYLNRRARRDQDTVHPPDDAEPPQVGTGPT
jgi:hypothetical protein